MRVPGALTRVGVLPYRLGDGTIRRELRLPEEVFAAASLATLQGATVTDLHPPSGVRADNWRDVAIGHVADDVHADADHVVGTVVVQDAAAVERIVDGDRKEISCGYEIEKLELSPGVWRGERYDAIQRGIRYNHVAIGPEGWGRAGPSVALRLDSADGVGVAMDPKDEEIARLRRELDETKGRADAADKAAKAATVRADEAEKAVPAKVASRARLLALRHVILGTDRADKKDEAMASSASDLDLMKEMLKKLDPSFDASNSSEDYVRGVFAANIKAHAAKAGAEPAPDAAPTEDAAGAPPAAPPTSAPERTEEERAFDSILSPRRAPAPRGRDDSNAPDADAARERMIARLKKGGSRGLPAN